MTKPFFPPTCKTATRPSRRTSAAAFAGDPPAPDDPLLGFAPYEHTAPRRNSITPERQREFIAALAATGIVTQAARTIGASLEALYSLRNRKGAEGFAAAWEEALDRGVARLEDCALERAIQGQERVLINRAGEVVAQWVQYDTNLVTFFLRQRRSERFAVGGGFASLRPGHPVFERLRAEWERERAAMDAEAAKDARASLLRKREQMRDEVLAEAAERDAAERGAAESGPDESPAPPADPSAGPPATGFD